MALQYSLYENYLTEKSGDYSAKVLNVTTHNLESIIKKMLQRTTTVGEEDATAALIAFETVVKQIIEDGESINTELFSTSFSITGSFDGQQDSFNSTKHRLHLRLNPSDQLKALLPSIQIQKSRAQVALSIDSVLDNASNTENTQLTSLGVVDILGDNIKVEGDNSDVGLFVVPAQGEPVPVTNFVMNSPSRLIAVLPQLAPGSYKLSVVTQYGKGTLLRTSRSVTTETNFTVE